MTKRPLSKILFIDDEEDVLTIAKHCLEKLKNVSVHYATSGEQAIQTALHTRPDLILLDVMMPKMNGIETLQALKLLPTVAGIPVVFFTARAQEQERHNYFKLGIVEIISKPFDPHTLAPTLEKIWDKYQPDV